MLFENRSLDNVLGRLYGPGDGKAFEGVIGRELSDPIDDHSRFKIGAGVTAPWNAPPPGAVPAMDGFVADYISTFTGEVGRQPTYEEYAQIMAGYTPEQQPVLSGIAREFGVFDHWFSEVPCWPGPRPSGPGHRARHHRARPAAGGHTPAPA